MRLVRLDWESVEEAPKIGGAGVVSSRVGSCLDIVVVIPSMTVGSGETGAEVGGHVDRPPYAVGSEGLNATCRVGG